MKTLRVKTVKTLITISGVIQEDIVIRILQTIIKILDYNKNITDYNKVIIDSFLKHSD